MCKIKTCIRKSDTSNKSALSFEKMLILNVQHFVYKQSFFAKWIAQYPKQEITLLKLQP